MSQHVSCESDRFASGNIDSSFPAASLDCEMAASSRQKVVVVGAGPVGSLAALYAASRGDEVEVYELRGGTFNCLLLLFMLEMSGKSEGCPKAANIHALVVENEPQLHQIYTTSTTSKVPVSSHEVNCAG
jgi:alkyl hydroperoxide reductase subunit AhpF